jgi:hypothetical protein
MPALDVFNQSAFNTLTLASRVNNPEVIPFVPRRTDELGLFTAEPITTDKVMIEVYNGQLQLVPTNARGAPPARNKSEKRDARIFQVPQVQLEDRIMADELLGVRAFGAESEIITAQSAADRKWRTMFNSIDATREHLRMGALKGQILDSNGSTVIYNLFTEFGVTQADEVNFALGTDATKVRDKCSAVIRLIEDALQDAPYESVHGFCSSQFFDALVEHPKVIAAWERWQNGEALRMRTARRMFFYGGIMFEEYRGKVGGVDFVGDDKAQFFPVGVQGLFAEYFAPGDFIETANTAGLPRYAKVAPDAKYNRFVDLLAQSNPLPMCARPKALVRGRRA